MSYWGDQNEWKAAASGSFDLRSRACKCKGIKVSNRSCRTLGTCLRIASRNNIRSAIRSPTKLIRLLVSRLRFLSDRVMVPSSRELKLVVRKAVGEYGQVYDSINRANDRAKWLASHGSRRVDGKSFPSHVIRHVRPRLAARRKIFGPRPLRGVSVR